MSKVIPIRFDDDDYNLLKTMAQAEKRPLSNYISFKVITAAEEDLFVSDEEQLSIEDDEGLMQRIKKSRGDIKKGKYRIV